MVIEWTSPKRPQDRRQGTMDVSSTLTDVRWTSVGWVCATWDDRYMFKLCCLMTHCILFDLIFFVVISSSYEKILIYCMYNRKVGGQYTVYSRKSLYFWISCECEIFLKNFTLAIHYKKDKKMRFLYFKEETILLAVKTIIFNERHTSFGPFKFKVSNPG